MMKAVALVLLSAVLTATISLSAASQEQKKNPFKINSLSLSSGEGPLSAGLFFEAGFSRGHDILSVSLGERDMYAVYLKSLAKDRLYLGPSFEYYHNVPLLGVMLNSTPLKIGDLSINTMTWTGISAGKPDGPVELDRWRYLFFWQSIDASYKRITAMGAIMNFDGGWGPLVDLKYRQPINDNWQLFSSAGYSWYGSGKALLKIGLTYNFN